MEHQFLYSKIGKLTDKESVFAAAVDGVDRSEFLEQPSGTAKFAEDRSVQAHPIDLTVSENARVVWHACEMPWVLEAELISCLELPLNLDQNTRNKFFPSLSRLRREAKARGRELPIPASMSTHTSFGFSYLAGHLLCA